MNIWEWYNKYSQELRDAGQEYIPQLIDDYSESVMHLQMEKCDSLLPEVKALTQVAKNPWLEIFIGHWEMRHRLTNREEGEKVLPDVVALFEKAHREEAKDCPQSICVTQDLSACYENIDAPGWANERMAVCEETIARIDATWSCFQCLSTEYASALIDSKRAEEALAYLDRQIDAVKASGDDDIEALLNTRADILIELQRYDEARKLIDELAEENDYWGRDRISYQLKKLYIMALCGQDEDVWAELPRWADLTPFSWGIWIKIITALLPRHPQRNNWQLARIIQKMLEHRSQAGAHRKVVNLAKLQITLALERESVWVAKIAMKLAQRHIPKLRVLLGVDREFLELSEKIAAKEAELLARPVVEVPENSDEETQPDPEKDVETFRRAYLNAPDDAELLGKLVNALNACNAIDESIELLQRYVESHIQEDNGLCFDLLDLLIHRDDLQTIEHLAKQYEQAGLLHMALWFRARVINQQEDWSELESIGQQLLQHEKGREWVGVYRMCSWAAQKQEARDRQLDYLQQLQQLMISREEDIRNLQWDIMATASILQQWDLVRAIAAELEIELTEGEGFIDEKWGLLNIRFRENYEYRYYYAQRIGPVTARIIEPTYRTDYPQHVDEVVVFDAEMLNTQPEDEEERKNFTPLYACLQTIIPTEYGESWFCEGVMPGEEEFNTFREALRERNWYYWSNSNDDYTLTDSHQGEGAEPLPAFYFVISAPRSISKGDIDKTLHELTADWEHPLCWWRLAKEAGANEEKHAAIAERYGM
ncbi:hypothetical protein ACXLI6_002494 [Escherichia coli]|uniref:hypothetical protein n=1 Tax=Escherichia coli TaxID=562 RepID=UPI00403FA8C6